MANKTKIQIVNSFLSLANKDEISPEKISITDIVEECGISRQTFYYHFKDINEMLEWAIENETKLIEKDMSKYDNLQDTLLLYESFFMKFGTFLKKCLNSKMFIQVYSMIYNSFFDFTKQFYSSKSKYNMDEKFEFLIQIYAYSLIGFMINELKKDKPDFSQMIRYIHKNLSSQPK